MKNNMRNFNIFSSAMRRMAAAALLLLGMAAGSAWAQTNYEFMFIDANNNHRFVGEETAAASSFVPNKSIYSGTTGGSKFQNGNGKYLRKEPNNNLKVTDKSNDATTLYVRTITGSQYGLSTANSGSNTWLYKDGNNLKFNGSNNRVTALTVASTAYSAGYSDFVISGDGVICEAGTYTYTHTNSTSTPAYTQYVLSGYNNGSTAVSYTYYSTNDNDAASTNIPAGTTVTTGYVWSLSGNSTYATVDPSTGAITVNSIPNGSVPMTLTCTLNGVKTASMTVTLTDAAPVGYVFTYQNSHFLGGSSTTDITTFNPSTCLWTVSGNLWKNSAGYYLYNVNNNSASTSKDGTVTVQTTNTDRTWTLEGTESGTTGQRISRTTSGSATRYLYFNSSSQWKSTTSSTQTRRNVVFAVTKSTYPATQSAPTISGDNQISALGTNSSFSRTDASYVAGYLDYIFYNGAHHYCLTETSNATSSEPTVASRTHAFTYTWSLEGISSSYATINSSTGVINYVGAVPNDVNATVKLTATSQQDAGISFVVTQPVTFKASRTNPTGITITSPSPLSITTAETGQITYTLTPNPCYNNVTFSSANSSVATVDANGMVTGLNEGQTTVTVTAKKIDGTTAATATVTVNVTEAQMYVIYYDTVKSSTSHQDHYLGGSDIDALSDFSPATCLWTVTADGKWQNSAGYYLSTNSSLGLTTSSSSAQVCRLEDTEHGTIGQILYNNSTDKFLRLSVSGNDWEWNTQYKPYNVVFAVTKRVYPAQTSEPAISGPAVIAQTGTSTLYSHTEAADHVAYIDYIFHNGDHHYFLTDNVTPMTNPALPFTYTWSLEGISSTYATIDNNGYIHYNSYVSSDVTATVKLTAVSDNNTFVVTMPVTFKPPVNPDGITATCNNPLTIYVGRTGAITYALTPTYAYNNVTYQSASTATATVAADGTVTGVAVGQTTVTLTAKKTTGTAAATATVTVNVRDKVETPVIAFAPNGATASCSITCATPGSTIKYTVNGGDEQTYSGAFTVNTNDVVVAYATSSNSFYDPSDAATSGYSIATGIAGGVVTLNDMEDHTWTYYAGVDSDIDPGSYNTTYAGRLYSPDPRNVKITYKGNGRLADGTAVNSVKVGIDAPESTFVYYKTIENNGGYKYTAIPNPFSVRPKVGTTYYGFSHWRVVSVNGGSISGKAVGGTINADEEITFVPTRAYTTNCISMEVELEAVWDVAEVRTSGSFTNNYGVERMFYVYTSSKSENISANSKACTYTSIYPNGTTDGSTAATMSNRSYRRATFSCSADSKFEYIYLDNNSSTMDANGKNLTIGRGVANHNGSSYACANKLIGINTTASDMNFKVRVESGRFNYFAGLYSDFASTVSSKTFGGTNKVQTVLGCDYDRAAGTNDNMVIATEAWMGEACRFSGSDNKTNGYYKCWLKSGKVITVAITDGNGGENSFYIGTSGNHNQSKYIFPRYLYIEGGEVGGVAGGMDDTVYTDASDFRVLVRMTGGYIRGCLYGAGSYAKGAGERRYVITGGEIGGWIASGCNGIGGSTTEDANGSTNGNGYMYIGGTAAVGYKDATVNDIAGGNIFGTGRGTGGQSYPVGTMNNSNIVIADDARIEHNVYGGGNYGYVASNGTATVYVVGGTVDGSVFGGSNLERGQEVDIIMTDGLVKTGIYGGSNSEGTINKNVSIRINGGQVGTPEADANIHGGGYGKDTRVSRNVDVTIGKSGAAEGPVVYGDVYGGSALGYVNGTAATTSYHTNVTLNAGTVHGDIYGGGLGNASNAANVYGPVTVNIHGGEAERVFGCNNTNGRPMQNTNHVNMDGGTVGYIYGGGNAAAYTGTPYVDMEGGKVTEHVFGGGLGTNAKITGSTNVTIRDNANVLKNVYGGGNAAEVTGDTFVKIK